MYQIVVTPSAKRAAKKLPEDVKKEMIGRAKKLKENPRLGEKLSGSLHFLYSLHVTFRETEYRLAYTIDESRKFIVVHLVGSRENFYEKLKRLF